jgi:hypothetical protein
MGRKRDIARWCASVREEVALGRGKGGDNASWVDMNLTRPKYEENLHGQFNCYKLTVKI